MGAMPERLEWLNYHHLLYFWLTEREGGVTRAAKALHLSHATVSAQIHALEEALGEPLFLRHGRGLVLTDMCRIVYGYADEIFSLGRELMHTVRGRPTGGPLKLSVGIVDVVPKLVARSLIAPALSLEQPVQLFCREDDAESLLAQLMDHRLDVVLSDGLPGAESSVRAYGHLLLRSAVAAYAVPPLAARLRRNFPHSLAGAPVLLPSQGTALRRALDAFFRDLGVVPRIMGEFDDSALLKAFAQDGLGVLFAPMAVEGPINEELGLSSLGRVGSVRARFFALTSERRIKHPAVVAMSKGARRGVVKG
jgi:LysR family transcriptional activator of nhaA